MDITEQRVAICKAETTIEAVLDGLSKEEKLQTTSIVVQTIMDKDKLNFPLLKVNIVVSKKNE